MRLPVAVLIASCLAAVITFVACGDTSFSSSDGDAGADAAADAGLDSDLASDADIAGDATDPCTSDASHAICDDFNQPTFSGIWTSAPGCAVPTLDDTESVSPPRSMRTGNDDAGAPPPSCVGFLATVAPSATQVHCEAQVRLDQMPSGSSNFLTVSTTFSGGVTYHQLALTYSTVAQSGPNDPVYLNEYVTLLDGGSSFQLAPALTGSAAVASSQWFKVILDIDYVTKQATATIAGKQASLSLQFIPDGGTQSGTVYFSPSVDVFTDGGVAVVHYDDIFCDVAP
jgi:hypothetical protein